MREEGTHEPFAITDQVTHKQGGIQMRVFYRLLALAAILFCGRSSPAEPSKAPLTAEQSQVYADFIQSLGNANFKFVSQNTFPLDLSSVPKDAACLHDLQLDSTAYKSIHSLGQEVLRGRAIRFLSEQEETATLKRRDTQNPSADSSKDGSGMTKDPGVLALSEIAFDKNHRFAVLKYVFLCGSHCNSGAIIILERVGSQWTGTTKRPCTFIMNSDNPRS
jgi:hypothetical protein